MSTFKNLSHSFELAGDGYWGAEASRSVTITGFEVQYYDADEAADYGVEEGAISHVTVDHDSTWDVYTDSAFVAAAQHVTGIEDLDFTEQGMQEDNRASMEV